MSYGLYLSAAGALSSMHRQDVLANNLANMNTVGFKPDQVVSRQRLPERLESPNGYVDPKWMLEQLGGGQFIDPTRVNMMQGDLVSTGNDLDVAISGDGMFVVAGATGTGPEHVRMTRDGRFTLNEAGELVMAANGRRVLDTGNQPIELTPGVPVRIDTAGGVRQNGAIVATLQLVDAPPGTLVKEGENLMRYADGETPTPRPFTGRLEQGHTEASAVDPIMTMNGMMAAAKSAQSNLKMMQYHDQLLGQVFNTFGRVA